MHKNNFRGSYCQVTAPLSRTCCHMWSDLGHLQLMLSWLALHVSSPYLAGLNIRKVRNCLVTAVNCHCTLYTYQPMSQHLMGLLPMLLQPIHNCFSTFQKSWPLPKPFLFCITAHTACPSTTPQVITISTLTQVHVFCQYQPTQCLAQHMIITAAQHCLALKPPSPNTKQPSTKSPMPCTITQGQHHLLLLNIIEPIFAHHGHPLPWPWGIMWRKVPPHIAPHDAHHSESNRETELVSLKEQLGASLDRHEELLVY